MTIQLPKQHGSFSRSVFCQIVASNFSLIVIIHQTDKCAGNLTEALATSLSISPTKGARSKGAEFELNGALTDNLQMTFGATRYVASDSEGRYNPDQPQTDLKLFTRYRLPVLQALTIGGGINWQNRVFEDVTAPDGSTQRVYQGSYPLASLFAHYQINKQVSVQANVNNLFDRTYYTYMSGYVYGEPRNFSVNVAYQF